jgi:hypothetical protein
MLANGDVKLLSSAASPAGNQLISIPSGSGKLKHAPPWWGML